MVFLPLLLLWLRDPMYFNAPSRWALVLLAVSSGLWAPRLLSEPPLGTLSVAVAAEIGELPAMDPEIRRPARSHGIPRQARLREGTQLSSLVGRFSELDGGWMFQSEGMGAEATATQPTGPNADAALPQQAELALRVLENLTLQRVAQMIEQDPASDRWLISGSITEYFGENRLILTAAVRATPPAESAQ